MPMERDEEFRGKRMSLMCNANYVMVVSIMNGTVFFLITFSNWFC